eukprot:754108-Hanusia_phi.AAC.7
MTKDDAKKGNALEDKEWKQEAGKLGNHEEMRAQRQPQRQKGTSKPGVQLEDCAMEVTDRLITNKLCPFEVKVVCGIGIPVAATTS